MSAQGVAKAPEPCGPEPRLEAPAAGNRMGQVLVWGSSWKQVLIAEILSLFERKRYD